MISSRCRPTSRLPSRALQLKLLGNTVARASANPDAYSAYLQGKFAAASRNAEGLGRAVGYFEEAIRLDPNFAPAWAAVSSAYELQGWMGYAPYALSTEKARTAAERAIALDPNLGEAYAALGVIQRGYDWNWAAAKASYDKALALAPAEASILQGASSLALTQGRLSDALAMLRRAAELDPLNASVHTRFGDVAYYAGRLDQAAAEYRTALEINPDFGLGHMNLAVIYLAQGRPQQALAEIQPEKTEWGRWYGLALACFALGRARESDAALADLIRTNPDTAAFQIAEVYAFRGEADQAFAWLDKAYAQRDGGLTLLPGDPLLKKISGDARYAALLKKLGLAANSGK